MCALNHDTMAFRVSTFIGLSSVVLITALTLTALAISLLKELEAKRRAKQRDGE